MGAHAYMPPACTLPPGHGFGPHAHAQPVPHHLLPTTPASFATRAFLYTHILDLAWFPPVAFCGVCRACLSHPLTPTHTTRKTYRHQRTTFCAYWHAGFATLHTLLPTCTLPAQHTPLPRLRRSTPRAHHALRRFLAAVRFVLPCYASTCLHASGHRHGCVCDCHTPPVLSGADCDGAFCGWTSWLLLDTLGRGCVLSHTVGPVLAFYIYTHTHLLHTLHCTLPFGCCTPHTPIYTPLPHHRCLPALHTGLHTTFAHLQAFTLPRTLGGLHTHTVSTYPTPHYHHSSHLTTPTDIHAGCDTYHLPGSHTLHTYTYTTTYTPHTPPPTLPLPSLLPFPPPHATHHALLTQFGTTCLHCL